MDAEFVAPDALDFDERLAVAKDFCREAGIAWGAEWYRTGSGELRIRAVAFDLWELPVPSGGH
jgi:hypothetical protein